MDQQCKSEHQSDAEVEMMEQFTTLQQQNERLKLECARLQKLLDEVTCSNDSQRICECAKKLRYMSIQSQNSDKKCCKCQKVLQEVSRVWWNCHECNYNVCRQCEGYKRNVCPFSHFLEYKQLNPDIEEQQVIQQNQIIKKQLRKCDICLANITSNYYTCTCGYDMCKACKDK